MSKQLIIRIDADLKDRLFKLAQAEGKPASRLVRDIIAEYVKERDIGAYIDELWARIADKLKTKGVTPRRIDAAVEASRKGSR
jgi:predicted DNA-binding protein